MSSELREVGGTWELSEGRRDATLVSNVRLNWRPSKLCTRGELCGEIRNLPELIKVPGVLEEIVVVRDVLICGNER